VVLRIRILSLVADGKSIAATRNFAPRMVTLWWGRSLEKSIAGLLKDAPWPGRTSAIATKVTIP